MRNHTKIVCTIGPSVSSYEKICELIKEGMNVARINFSHGTHEEHRESISLLKKARNFLKKPLAILLDTHGPKIQVGALPQKNLSFQPGDRFCLVPQWNQNGQIPIEPFAALEAVQVGTQILFDDGYLICRVVEKGGKEIVVEVENRGILREGKGVNIPGIKVPLPALTEKDKKDLQFGCQEDVDWVAASFIRSAQHVLSIKNFLSDQGRSDILVIAKIESTEGVENFDSIMQVADGIMVARGDLGVEVDLALVPKYQKQMIRKCYGSSKPVITATQMLESMILHPRPTRAEVSDVANAIYDSTSAVMLSGETAVGKYPIETLKQMSRVVYEAEEDFDYAGFFNAYSQRDYHDVSSAVSIAAVKTAYAVGAKAIVALTTSGQTARLLSRLRPSMPIIAVTSQEKIAHQLALNWGVFPLFSSQVENRKEAMALATKYALSQELIVFGDVVVLTAGIPFGKAGSTNMIMVETIGEILVRGHKALGPKIEARVCFLRSPEGVDPKQVQDCLLVVPYCDASFLPVFKKARGVILQNALYDTSSEKYLEMVGKTFALSVMSRADGAFATLQEGEKVTFDPSRAIVYRGDEGLSS